MRKRIIYLDQNFVSNLAKTEHLPDWQDPLADYYSQLLGSIRAKVKSNRLVCPKSSFHREESEQSHRIRSFSWILYEELSQGLSLNSPNSIHFKQLELAAMSYCKRTLSNQPHWYIPFNRDPNELVDWDYWMRCIQVHLQSAKELVDYYEEMKDIEVEQYGKFKASRKGQSINFLDEVNFLKMQLLYDTFVPVGEWLQRFPNIDKAMSWIGEPGVTAHQSHIVQILENCPNGTEFLESQELMQCPFLNIRATLMAADIFYYPVRSPNPSLITDFNIVASVLPYVDILATDRHMAHLIRTLKWTEQYDVGVYSMSQKDELLETISAI